MTWSAGALLPPGVREVKICDWHSEIGDVKKGSRSRRIGLVLGLLVLWRVGTILIYRPLAPWVPYEKWREPSVDVGVAFHVHSRHSHDGRAPLSEIVQAARTAGVGAVVVTDHQNMDLHHEGGAGWRDGVLVIGGAEIGTCEQVDPRTGGCRGGHALVLGVEDLPAGAKRMSARELLETVHHGGGFVVAAHPTHPRIPWKDPEAAWDGIEVASLFTSFGRASIPGKAGALLLYALNPRLALLSLAVDGESDLRAWAARLEADPSRTPAALGAVDAHAHLRLWRDLTLPIPSMVACFGTLQTHVLLERALPGDDGDAACRQVLDALRRGRSYVSWDALGDPRGFRFVASSGHRFAGPGQRLPARRAAIHVLAPAAGDVRLYLYRGAELLHSREHDGIPFEVQVGPGVYWARATCRTPVGLFGLYREVTWVVFNPIRIVEPESREGGREK